MKWSPPILGDLGHEPVSMTTLQYSSSKMLPRAQGRVGRGIHTARGSMKTQTQQAEVCGPPHEHAHHLQRNSSSSRHHWGLCPHHSRPPKRPPACHNPLTILLHVQVPLLLDPLCQTPSHRCQNGRSVRSGGLWALHRRAQFGPPKVPQESPLLQAALFRARLRSLLRRSLHQKKGREAMQSPPDAHGSSCFLPKSKVLGLPPVAPKKARFPLS
jgi:hypothetical protein